VTFLYDLRNISKDVAQTLAKGLISRSGDVTSAGENFLVITDSSANIKRLVNILEKVDISGASSRIRLVDLFYADAKEIQGKLSEIFDTKGGGDRSSSLSAASRAARIRSGLDDDGGGSSGSEGFSLQKIIADERTNKLIVIASDKAFDRIKEVIDLLDKPSSDASSTGQVNVYEVKNGDAKKIAATLSGVAQGQGSRKSGPGGREEPGTMFEGEIKINADEATNSLVIISSPRDYKNIVRVIEKLDKKRIQVYVEAVIMDINLSSNQSFGLNLFGAVPGPNGTKMIFGNPGGQSLVSGVVSALKDSLAVPNITPGLQDAAALASMVSLFGILGPTIPGTPIPSFGATLQALKTNSDVDILSTPSMMTLDNEKAEISVGERIPVIKGASTVGVGGTSGLIPFQNVDYVDVKLKFALTPHVNNENQVRLEIEQEVNDLGAKENLLGQTQYRIKSKSAKTTVVAKDQQTVVIGGLISENKSNSESKVPILGDIPILGWLAKNRSKSTDKKNLLLVLTPYVIREDEDFQKVLDRKMKEREEFSKLNLGGKPATYDATIDFDKKTGPLGHAVQFVGEEMQRAENGGPGLPGETIITPKETPIDAPSTTQSVDLPVENLEESVPEAVPPVPPAPEVGAPPGEAPPTEVPEEIPPEEETE